MRNCKKIILALFILLLTYSISFAEAQTYNLVVPAQPVWTNTGIDIFIGDKIIVTAEGTWNYGYYPLSPNGDQPWEYPNTWDRFLYQANHGELISYVGDDPYQGHWGDGTFFPQKTGYWRIGSYNEIFSDKNGKLWLGMNDDAVSMCDGDNSGELNVTVVIIRGAITLLQIDIKPNSYPNSINLKSKGVVPVAIFGGADFDVKSIDLGSIYFASAKPSLKATYEDVNNDGFVDMMLHFKTEDIKLSLSSKQACIVGYAGDKAIYGCDSIRVLK